MSYFNGPKTVSDGLIFYLDSGSQKSYPAACFVSARVYSTYNGGVRSANYTVQYSDDNTNWTTAFSGIARNNEGGSASCGINNNTGAGSASYGRHRYWRYVEGSAVVSHHPRVSRIILVDDSNTEYNLIVYLSDNCSDLGTYIVGTVSVDVGSTTWTDLSGNGNSGTLNGPAYGSSNAGYISFDGVNDYVSITNNSSMRPSNDLTIEYAIKGVSSAQWTPILGYGNGDYTNGNYLVWVEVGGGLNSLCRINNNGVTEYRQYSNQGISNSVWKVMCFTMKMGGAIRSYYNGVDTNTPTSLPSAGTFYYGGTTSAYQIGGFGGSWLNSNIAYMKLYNRELSASEALQNFNAVRGRFGL